MYRKMIDEANAKVAALEDELDGLNDRIPGVQRQIQAMQENCDRIQT